MQKHAFVCCHPVFSFSLQHVPAIRKQIVQKTVLQCGNMFHCRAFNSENHMCLKLFDPRLPARPGGRLPVRAGLPQELALARHPLCRGAFARPGGCWAGPCPTCRSPAGQACLCGLRPTHDVCLPGLAELLVINFPKLTNK